MILWLSSSRAALASEFCPGCVSEEASNLLTVIVSIEGRKQLLRPFKRRAVFQLDSFEGPSGRIAGPLYELRWSHLPDQVLERSLDDTSPMSLMGMGQGDCA